MRVYLVAGFSSLHFCNRVQQLRKAGVMEPGACLPRIAVSAGLLCQWINIVAELVGWLLATYL